MFQNEYCELHSRIICVVEPNRVGIIRSWYWIRPFLIGCIRIRNTCYFQLYYSLLNLEGHNRMSLMWSFILQMLDYIMTITRGIAGLSVVWSGPAAASSGSWSWIPATTRRNTPD